MGPHLLWEVGSVCAVVSREVGSVCAVVSPSCVGSVCDMRLKLLVWPELLPTVVAHLRGISPCQGPSAHAGHPPDEEHACTHACSDRAGAPVCRAGRACLHRARSLARGTPSAAV
jgi:hypothetical protein